MALLKITCRAKVQHLSHNISRTRESEMNTDSDLQITFSGFIHNFIFIQMYAHKYIQVTSLYRFHSILLNMFVVGMGHYGKLITQIKNH